MKFLFSLLFTWFLLALGVGHAQDRQLNVVFIPKSSDQVFWDLMRAGVDKAVQEDGNVKLTWRGPAHNDDTDSQIRILQAYTRKDVDAILITPTDRARLVEPVRAATALGIQVVVVDSALDGKFHSNMVSTDNLRGGRLAARHMAELLNHQGKVMVLRTVPGSASTDERAEGFKAYLKESEPRIQLVADVYGGGSVGKARHSALDLLRNNPAVDGVFTVNESATDGMLRAVREQGRTGLRFVGFDSTDLLIQAVEHNEIQGLVIQNPRQMGYVGIKAAVAAARGAPLKEKNLFTDTTLLTRDNVHSADIRKLICTQC